MAGNSREAVRRAGLLAQAGQAWLLAGKTERAFAVLTAALKLAPTDPKLYVDRAQILADARNYWEAIDDLNAALDLAPGLVEALVFRASAYRFVEAFDLAWQDVEGP
ncbi:MAG: TPR repeat-containing protein [Rhodospirillaceae bacterium]|nr:MAG: TPR repeat-containing protein [Rhodospirillaceae bacterium]